LVPGISGAADAYLTNLTYNIPASGTISLILPAGYGSKVSSGSSGYAIIGDSVYWTYTNYQSSTTMTYTVFFKTPLGTPLGSVLNACARVIVNGGDLNPVNNYSCFQGTVTGSYDPNDKAVSPVGQGSQGDITTNDKTLIYNIRFQNTGNGPAINIVVKDTLSDKLDISTLEVIEISHNYILDVLPGNELRWKFNNIMLADSFSNEPASHGWIVYKINQAIGNLPGDKIKNTAHIYFDFNSAVVTNTALNTIATPTAIAELPNTYTAVNAYPNPFSDNTTFIIQSDKSAGIYSFELLDILGKQVRSMTGINTKQFQFSRNSLPNGIYFYKIYNAESIVGAGKLIHL